MFTADDYTSLDVVSVVTNKAEGCMVDIAIYLVGEEGHPESGTLVSKQPCSKKQNKHRKEHLSMFKILIAKTRF